MRTRGRGVAWRASIICLVVVHTRQELKLLHLLLSVGWLKNQHATSSLDSTMGRATPESGSSAHTSSCCTPSGYTAASAPTPSPSASPPSCYCSRAGRRVGARPNTAGSSSDLRYGSSGGYSACYPATEEGRHSQMFRQIARFFYYYKIRRFQACAEYADPSERSGNYFYHVLSITEFS